MGHIRNRFDVLPAAKGRRVVPADEDRLFGPLEGLFQGHRIVEVSQLDVTVAAPVLMVLEVLPELEIGFIIDDDRPGLDEVQDCIEGF